MAADERDAVTALTGATDTMNQASLSVVNGASSQTLLRVIDAPIWWARGGLRPTPLMLWIAWLAGAGALVALTTRLPGCEWCAALLLGGSLSHMIETSRRGRVCDYLCLRFWPAFNLADAAISIGTVGFIVGVISALVNLLH